MNRSRKKVMFDMVMSLLLFLAAIALLHTAVTRVRQSDEAWERSKNRCEVVEGGRFINGECHVDDETVYHKA